MTPVTSKAPCVHWSAFLASVRHDLWKIWRWCILPDEPEMMEAVSRMLKGAVSTTLIWFPLRRNHAWLERQQTEQYVMFYVPWQFSHTCNMTLQPSVHGSLILWTHVCDPLQNCHWEYTAQRTYWQKITLGWSSKFSNGYSDTKYTCWQEIPTIY